MAINWVRGEHLQHNFLYTCTTSSRRGHAQLVMEHSLGYLISGEIHFHTNRGIQVIREGTMGIIRKNELAKSVKLPPPGGELKAINILLTQEHLRRYAAENNIAISTGYPGEPMLELSNDPFLKGYFDSLMPYFEHPDQLTQAMTDLKTFEAIQLLLRRPGLREMLFDFTEPFKIDLEAFMNTNYKYNVPLNQFARGSGRSLATFKRDFKKMSKQPPERWLHEKRLEMAHYLISQRKQTPAEVYLEVGFENMSHFSASFKKHFGYNASSIGS